MTEWPELPSIDTMMTTLVFYGLDRKPSIREAKAFIDAVCGLLGETPSNVYIGMGDGKSDRHPKFGLADKAIATGAFDEYKYIEGLAYFAKGNVRDCCLAVSVFRASARPMHPSLEETRSAR